MRILIIAGFADSLLNFRGVLIDYLIQQGNEVHVAAPDHDASDGVIESLLNKGVIFHAIKLVRTGMNPLHDLKSFLQLRRLIKGNRIDVVLAYTIKPVIWGGLAARTLGISNFYALITGLGYAFQRGGGLRNGLVYLVKILYSSALKNAKGVIFQNSDNKQVFVNQGIIHHKQSYLVNGSGVDLNHFEKLPLPDAPKFLLIGRLLKDKGVIEYCEAAKQVKSRCPSAEFHLVGPEDPSPNGLTISELDSYIRQGVVQYHGAAKDVRPFLKDCSIFVLPSYHEGMPRTVLEAMAMARPILTTNVPGCKETVVNGVNGWLVDKASVEQLAERMLWFISNSEQWKMMGEQSYQMAVEKYDVHKVNAELIRIMGLSNEKTV